MRMQKERWKKVLNGRLKVIDTLIDEGKSYLPLMEERGNIHFHLATLWNKEMKDVAQKNKNKMDETYKYLVVIVFFQRQFCRVTM